MQSSANTVDEYIAQVPAERISVMKKLRRTILENIPNGFEECMSYGIIGYVVPHSIFPEGYHCNPKLPLPFLNIASQKNFVALYHGGLYASPELMSWFVNEYPKYCKRKLDMGKSCVRFKKLEELPYSLIGELVGKMSVAEWIKLYFTQRNR